MPENKSQFRLFNLEKYRVRPIPGKPEKPKGSFADLTESIQKAANGNQYVRQDFHQSMEEPAPKKPHHTQLEKRVLLTTRSTRFLARMEKAGLLEEIMTTPWTGETLPQLAAKVQQAKAQGIKLDPQVEKELLKKEKEIGYWLALRMRDRAMKLPGES